MHRTATCIAAIAAATISLVAAAPASAAEEQKLWVATVMPPASPVGQPLDIRLELRDAGNVGFVGRGIDIARVDGEISPSRRSQAGNAMAPTPAIGRPKPRLARGR